MSQKTKEDSSHPDKMIATDNEDHEYSDDDETIYFSSNESIAEMEKNKDKGDATWYVTYFINY